MKTLGLKHDVGSRHMDCSNLSGLWRKASGLAMAGFALLAAGFLTLSVQAQTTMTLKPTSQRVEVPTGNANTYYVNPVALRIPTNGASGTDITGTNWVIANANVSISGAPSGCTASIVDNGLVNPVGTIPINMNTNNASFTTNVIVKLVFDGTEVSGTTNLVITATGAGLPEDDRIVPLDVAKIWNGAGNAAANGAGSWSDSSKWLGGAPQTGDTVVFTDFGGQTNSLLKGSAFLTNSLVSANVTLSSLRFAVTNSSTNFQNLYITPGVNLAIAGTGGFQMLRDYSYWNHPMFISIWGTNGTFIQTNENSSFTLLCGDDQQQSILDMSGLGNLYLDVNNLNIDSFQGYPNYFNAVYTNSMNGTTVGNGKPQKIYGTWRMALTNYVKATFVDPYNYTNALSRSYALTFGRNDGSGGGSGQDCEIFMGYSNVFNLDSICVAGVSCYGADFRFLNTNSYAKFRNADGVSRMSVFATADLGGLGFDSGFGDKSKCGGNGPGVDFTKGTVDMLVDRLYLSLDGTNGLGSSGSFSGFSQTSGFYVGAGTIDANTVIVGYQSQGSVTATATNAGTCDANLYVTNTALLKVNQVLTLGYTTAPLPASSASSGNPNAGVMNIGPGGTVMANTITVGGPAKTSAGNVINMRGNASLIVSNSIADSTPHGALGTLSLAGNNNTLEMFVTAANPTTPSIYVTNLTASGTGNKLVIGGITGLTAFPTNVVLIAGVNPSILISASAFDAGVTLPVGSGLYGVLFTSSSNTIDMIILQRTPSHLVWRGTPDITGSATWDHSTQNWLDQSTLLMTNYNDPDIVAFDDAPGYATNIIVSTGDSLFSPSAVNMTNNSLDYTFVSGGQQILGGAVFNKYGTNAVEIDDNTTFSVQLNQGNLAGNSSAAVGNVVVAAGASMNFGGTLSGSLQSAGVATSGGTINGTITVLSGGMVTNASTGTVNNPISVQSGGELVNLGLLNHVGVGSSGSPQISIGGRIINGGTIGNGSVTGDILYVAGTFEDLGGGASMTLQSVTVGASGMFIPGNDSTGTTTINNDGSATFDGALLLVQGSSTVLNANPGGSPLDTVVSCAHLSFGASSGSQNQNGATLSINNVGGPYAAGQSFRFFDNVEVPGTVPFSTGSSTNTFPVVVPQVPGPGLSWDLSHLWADGSIRVITTPQITLTNSFAIHGTNLVAQFSWDAAYSGYRLESQVNPLSVGLSTNWTGISGSVTNTSWTITNSLSSGSGNVNFYRLVFP